MPQSDSALPRPTLAQLALLFLKLGITGFGGPAAHIAMMEDEVVTRRRWMTRERFLDLVGATNLIPGPNSTEMAIHVGALAGWSGLVVAGVCFILPAALITGVLGWVYVEYGTLPEAKGVLFGVKPIILAVIAQALFKFGRESLKSVLLVIVALAAVGLSLVRVNELLILFGSGLVVMLARAGGQWRHRPDKAPAPMLPLLAASGAAGTTATAFGLWPLFWFFVKVGSVLYGSGYVLLAFLRADLVERYGWLTEEQLLDSVAVGQVTPGPVFTTATFIGYVLGGWRGAVVATVGIFLPAFVFVAISGPLVSRIRRSRLASAFLDGVVVGSLGLMAAVTVELTYGAFRREWVADSITVGMALLAGVLLVRYRVNSAWLVIGGAALGWLVLWLGWVVIT
jgi:chromate transporter